MASRTGEPKYTADDKRKAIERSTEIGPAEAARELGMPLGTLTCWTFKARRRAARTEDLPPRSEEPRRDTEVSDEAARPPDEQEAKNEKPSRVARRYTPSEKAEALEDAGKLGVSAASKKHGPSRYSIYDWKRKVERAAAGEGPSPTSGPSPSEVESRRDKEILDEWHRHPGLGPSQIRNQLRRKGVKVAVQTVRRVMEDVGYRPPKVRSQPHDERFESVRPHHMWHLDYVHRHINRASTHTLILLDDCSRYVVGHGVDDAERADLVIETFEEAVRRHGKPEMVLHDKGSAFWSWRGISRFTALLTELGVDQVAADHKEWNGKLEVFTRRGSGSRRGSG
jgi:transposase-like protein